MTPVVEALPEQRTIRGMQLVWRHAPLRTDDPVIAWQEILRTRDLQESDPFFSPRLSELPDPDVMQDMDRAASRLVKALQRREKIHVFGDFDADGVNGTAILLEALRAVDAEVSFSIPHRAEDGHGIGVQAVEQAHQAGITLGLSVDTGSTCFAACQRATELGLDLIITDHHLPESTLPKAYAVLNPARADCGFAERKLCGTGVAFFLLMAVWKRLAEAGARPAFDLRRLLDRVAVATVADVMELVGVNRILVHHGLQRLNNAPSVGMQALLEVARISKTVDAETIGFYLAPRINAAGRMQHGEAAMRLLATEDAAEAARLAMELDAANKQRRQVEADVFRQAEVRLQDAQVLAVFDANWHAGVVGLAAGRLARKYGRPAAVGFITPDDRIRVSLRGCPGFHIGDILNACAPYLEGFGGHAGAGGGTVPRQHWDAFCAAFGVAVAQQAAHVHDHLCLAVDGELGLAALHGGFAERLGRFEPWGQGNRPFSWLLRDVYIAERRELRGGVVRLRLSDGGRSCHAVLFQGNGLNRHLQQGLKVCVIGRLQLDHWQGRGAVQFIVEDAVLPDA